MRYKREAKVYSFPDIFRIGSGGEQGLFGELEGKPTLEVMTGHRSLAQRLWEFQFPDNLPFEKQRWHTFEITGTTLGERKALPFRN